MMKAPYNSVRGVYFSINANQNVPTRGTGPGYLAFVSAFTDPRLPIQDPVCPVLKQKLYSFNW